MGSKKILRFAIEEFDEEQSEENSEIEENNLVIAPQISLAE